MGNVKPSSFIWILCTAFAYVVLGLTTPLHGWDAVVTVGILGAVFGFLLLLALVAVTHSYDIKLWDRLFGPAGNDE